MIWDPYPSTMLSTVVEPKLNDQWASFVAQFFAHKSINPSAMWHPLTVHTTEKEKKKERCCSFEQIYRTMGLISADRSNKATLLLTIPRSIKVVCNGFISSNI
jgi:hypothetical protein